MVSWHPEAAFGSTGASLMRRFGETGVPIAVIAGLAARIVLPMLGAVADIRRADH